MAISSTEFPGKSGRVESQISASVNEIEPLVVKPRVAWRMLAVSNTRGYTLLNARELESFRDGKSRKIVVKSIHDYIARRLAIAATQNAKNPMEGATAARLARRAKAGAA